jgi:hypothetical protein
MSLTRPVRLWVAVVLVAGCAAQSARAPTDVRAAASSGELPLRTQARVAIGDVATHWQDLVVDGTDAMALRACEELLTRELTFLNGSHPTTVRGCARAPLPVVPRGVAGMWRFVTVLEAGEILAPGTADRAIETLVAGARIHDYATVASRASCEEALAALLEAQHANEQRVERLRMRGSHVEPPASTRLPPPRCAAD